MLAEAVDPATHRPRRSRRSNSRSRVESGASAGGVGGSGGEQGGPLAGNGARPGRAGGDIAADHLLVGRVLGGPRAVAGRDERAAKDQLRYPACELVRGGGGGVAAPAVRDQGHIGELTAEDGTDDAGRGVGSRSPSRRSPLANPGKASTIASCPAAWIRRATGAHTSRRAPRRVTGRKQD